MEQVKIHIKVGAVEVDYEGDGAFLENDLLAMIKELQKVAPPEGASDGAGQARARGGNSANGAQALTTKSIATKLTAKSGSDLAEAAVAHLSIIRGMPQFKRSDILEAMKSASGFYKVNMSKNLSNIIKNLLGQDTIIETSLETYAMTQTAESKLRGLLGIE